MSIDAQGWFDWMERVPYPAHKVNGGRNPLLGLAAHSAEGWEKYLRDYAQNQTRSASWHISNLMTAGKPPMQHYPVFAQTWTSGAGWPNDNLIGMESEGVAGTPLNDWQIGNVVRVLEDLREFTGRKKIERIGSRTGAPPDTLLIMEHSEATRLFGAPATACPSGRYNWAEILKRVNEKPEPPRTVPEIGGAAAVVWEPEIPRAYLFTGSHLEWIPSDAVYHDLVRALNVRPVTASPEGFAWMVDQHIRAGGSWPGRK